MSPQTGCVGFSLTSRWGWVYAFEPRYGSVSEIPAYRRKCSMHNSIRGFVSAALLAAASTVLSFSVAAQKVPEGWISAKEQFLLQVHVKGDQVYTCKSDAAQFTWTLKAPDAQLFDKDGKPFGKHFAGPSWEANDGSRVTGKAVDNKPSPAADSMASPQHHQPRWQRRAL